MANIKKAGFTSRNPIKNSDLLIPAGVYDGISGVNKFGRNAAVAASGTEEIWDGSAAYSFPATALMTRISQTTDQAALRGATVRVQGLDANWAYVSQDATLNASNTETAVALATPLIRCFRMQLLDTTTATSSIRVHNTAESQDYAIITAGENQTLMAIYTVPAGLTAYITDYYATHNPTVGQTFTSCPIRLAVADQANGYAKATKHLLGVPEDGAFHFDFNPYMKVTEKSDICITASPVGAAADISAGFNLILLANASYGG
jgi:hypothetical protein